MEIKPITVYVNERVLEGVLSTFEVSELDVFFDKALQTVFERRFDEVMSQPYDYSKGKCVKFKPSQSTYLLWCKLPKEITPYVIEAFDKVVMEMLNDYLYSLIEPVYKD